MSIPQALLVIVLTAGSTLADAPDQEERRQVMGTMARVAAWSDDPRSAREAVEAAYAAFARVDSLMSTWRDDSVLAALNRAPAGRWVPVGSEVASVLVVALEVAVASDGAYDPTILPLVRLWGFRGGDPAVPAPGSLAECLARVDHRRLEVDRHGGRARLLGEGMEVDLGGIAKGHALDAAAAAMRTAGATAGAVDLGGNLLVFGSGAATEIGVRDPRGGDDPLATLPLEDGAAATSGQYERFLVVDGRRFGHILDPRTGHPVPGGFSVTVLTDEAVRGDALATAAVVLGPARGQALLEADPHAEGLLIFLSLDGEPAIRATTGLVEAP